MSNSKFLSDIAWKDMLSKNKGVKDNGLLKVLADYKRLDDHPSAAAGSRACVG